MSDEQILACSRNVEGATRKYQHHPAIDDLRQAVWLRIVTKISTFDPSRANLSTFANCQAQGAMGDFWRVWLNVHHRVRYQEIPLQAVAPGEFKHDEMGPSENSATISMLLANSGLRPQEIIVIRLMLCDLTMPEIAGRTGFNLKTAYYYATAAIRKMREKANGLNRRRESA